MELTVRQEKILNTLIKEYIDIAEPISSDLLKKRCRLDISPATIRNEMQELTEQGYIKQPHTSAGRIPTNKAYRYFVDTIFSGEAEIPSFIFKEIEVVKQIIEKELQQAHELTKSLTEISTTLSYVKLEDKNNIFEVLRIMGPSKTTHDKNVGLISELLKELENF